MRNMAASDVLRGAGSGGAVSLLRQARSWTVVGGAVGSDGGCAAGRQGGTSAAFAGEAVSSAGAVAMLARGCGGTGTPAVSGSAAASNGNSSPALWLTPAVLWAGGSVRKVRYGIDGAPNAAMARSTSVSPVSATFTPRGSDAPPDNHVLTLTSRIRFDRILRRPDRWEYVKLQTVRAEP